MPHKPKYVKQELLASTKNNFVYLHTNAYKCNKVGHGHTSNIRIISKKNNKNYQCKCVVGWELNIGRFLSKMHTLLLIPIVQKKGQNFHSEGDLEILNTFEFLAFLVTRGNRESISAECKFFLC